jgi:chromosome segregation ATPase
MCYNVGRQEDKSVTPEERFERIEQKIEFITNWQAQFSADLQQTREELREEMRQKEAALQKQIDQHEKLIGELNGAVVALVGMVGRLSEGQVRLAEAQVRTEEGMRKLEEKAAETEERLNVFITVVERYISERQKGESEET